ncbi:uncharacterized protein N7477_006103 [Penicillium maclennaniae]|uniref:uncharacterized protein n=1 Tax=Penicillium maclennaniae TaxID=1343394 RepID=UPI002540C8C1|nr:uncharacterized protein N7477_006103 [Penicillium maclennaniae]KAJ5670740.1 hypothetical protein N7477_006103 [Penicillium maclennaniae]
MAADIPGFYYDPEKKKYFKIQANHVAPPGSQYSKESIKRKRKDKEKHEKRVQIKQREARETVRKAAFLHHPLLGAYREIGSPLPATARLDHQAQIYASQLRRKKLHQFEPFPKDYSIRHVLRNPRSGILIASGHHGGSSSASICFPDPDEEQWTYDRTMERMLFKDNFRLSSISLSHTGYLLATMDSGPEGESYLATRMLPDPDEDGDYRWPNIFAHPIRINTTSSMWCSAACPTGNKALFAIGTSDGLHTLEGFGSHWTLSQKPFPGEVSANSPNFRRHGNSTHASVNAVEWLSSDVIASGLRNSTIFLHDLRSGGSAARLKHPHSVSKIRKVDEYRMVVGGYNSLQMYDIRFAPEPDGKGKKPKPKHWRHSSTRPYLTFPDYSPDVIPDFDVSTELSLVASASDDRKIQLFSLQTGTPVASPLSKYRYSDPITCVCFESSEGQLNRHGPQTPSLLVCAKATVDQWIW